MGPHESADTPADVRLPWFWTLWGRNQSWRDNLSRQAAHKALDIPDTDMQISTTTTGVGWREMLILALSVLGAGALGAYVMGHNAAPSASAVIEAPPPAEPPRPRTVEVQVE